MLDTIPIDSLEPSALAISGRSVTPQPASLAPVVNTAPMIPTDIHQAHARLGRCLLEYRWLRGGSPPTPDFYYSTPAHALHDAKRTAEALLEGLRQEGAARG